jgi:hypothetical protein
VVLSVAAFPASLRADSLPAPPASSEAPGLVVDPTVMRADPAITWDPASRVYRMFTSETWFAFVPEWQSPKVTGPWHYVGDALPVLPTWHGHLFSTWAPEVEDVDGVWTMWASTAATADPQGYVCLFRATARTAAGPFTVDPRRVPCDADINGDIDPAMARVSGQWWLLDKTNANAVGKPTTLLSQHIGPDGMPAGPRFTLLTSDQPWESGMIEAPSLVQNSTTGQWWLVFSAGSTDVNNPTYQIYTTPCDGAEGPCHIGRVVKLVSRNAQGGAPGEEYAFDDTDGQAWIAYNPGAFFAQPTDRPVALVKLDFDDRGEPYVVTP